MFRKTKRKIVAVIMSILVVVWVGTIGFIYISSYIETTSRNEEMMKMQADMYVLPEEQKDLLPPIKEDKLPDKIKQNDNRQFGKGFNSDSPMFKLSRFYSVAISNAGETLDIKNDSLELHSNEELESMTRQIISDNKETGKVGNLSFYKLDKNDYVLVTYMDNTVVNENTLTWIRNTLIIGGVALLVLFFVSVYIAGRIVNPLEENYKKQKQFISDAGHELKTPVSVVSTNAEILSRQIGENQWLSNIQYENERMGLLVGQLLSLARTEDVKPVMENVDLSHIANGESLPFESVAFEKGLTLGTSIAKDIHVNGNSSQLKQLTAILLDNALRYCSENGTILLSLTKDHGMARLSVINNGEEIPKEQQAMLFERFYRADTVRNSADNHYGLGLSIAKAICDSHKGSIEVLCYDGLVEFTAKLPILKN